MEACEVTVYCTVYNHEKYVRKCLESLVSQKTTFRYSVIVHDDASTDRSADIIREFEERYPDIIIPIYQTENQHQLRRSAVYFYIEPLVNGKYVAICEGDDYWSSPDKLQKQYDAMESHPECGLCLHRTLEVTEEEELTGLEYPKKVFETGLITAQQLFSTLPERIYHTSSYFMRASYWHEYIKHPPKFKYYCTVGDIPILLYFGSRFGVYQINEPLSCYRRGAVSSWSYARFRADEKLLIRYHSSTVKTYQLFDEDTKGRYHAICSERISKHMFASNIMTGRLKEFLQPENRDYFNSLSRSRQLTVYAGAVFPSVFKRFYMDHIKKDVKEERNRWT